MKNKNKLIDYQEFEVGTGYSVSIRDFVSKMAHLLKSDSKLNFGALPRRVNDIEDSYANNASLKKMGWSPLYDLEKAINLMVKEKNESTVNL